MDTFQALGVEHRGAVTDQQGPGDRQQRHRVIAAHRQGFGTLLEHLAACDDLGDQRVLLEPQKCLVGLQHRIFIVETHHQADRDAIVFHFIEKSAAFGVQAQRIAEGVYNGLAGRQKRGGGRNFDDLFYRGLEYLGHPVVEYPQFGLHIPEQAAPGAFTENRHLRGQVHSRFKIRLRFAVFVDALVPGSDAADPAAGFIHQHFGAGKSGKQIQAELFGLIRQPAGELGYADDTAAAVVHVPGCKRNGDFPSRRQIVKSIPTFGGFQRKFLVHVIWNQLFESNGIEDGAAEGMRSDGIPFFDQADLDLQVMLLCQLQQVNGAGQIGRAAADKKYVKGIFFTLLVHDSPCIDNGSSVVTTWQLSGWPCACRADPVR